MGVMVQFSNPTYGGLKEPDPNPVVIGPFQEVRIEDGCVYGDSESDSIAIGYYDLSDNSWNYNNKEYGEMKIFSAPVVVTA